MQMANNTQVTEFILTGLTDLPELQIILFLMFLAIYALTLLGNLGVIILIQSSPQLHTPMYFFLSNLSVLDICYSSSVTPRLLSDFFQKKKTISFVGCFSQLFFYASFATTECYLLAVMAYDRYVAICNPLQYFVTMSPKKRFQLITVSYVAGMINALVHTVAASRLSFCGPNVINNFYCEGPPLIALSCSDIALNDMLRFVFVGFNMIATNLTIFISYVYILITILKIRSARSRQKAFSTCSSHLMVITIFYGSAGFASARPSSRNPQNLDKMASVLYTVVTPMLNPLIYSVRNKDVRGALGKVLGKKAASKHI
ncbi:olfactory receptor 5J3-like [Tiliqua scincoides]|uniref:olfactory receptor 5J3-like n=1 Tax=Tiliqua scincoides TaxID=71010 RepID=UPI0034625FCE